MRGGNAVWDDLTQHAAAVQCTEHVFGQRVLTVGMWAHARAKQHVRAVLPQRGEMKLREGAAATTLPLDKWLQMNDHVPGATDGRRLSMVTHHDGMGLEQFRAIAADWPRLKQLLAQRDVDSRRLIQPTVVPMATISQRRGTWELAVTAAAYSLLRQPSIIEARPGTDLSVVVDALSSWPGRSKLPGFIEIANEVASLPVSVLFRQVPRLSSMLREVGPLTAASMSCTAFCMSQHANDPDGFLRCMQDC